MIKFIHFKKSSKPDNVKIEFKVILTHQNIDPSR